MMRLGLEAPPAAASGRTGPPLAVFDLDGTLVAGDTFLPFLVGYAVRRRKLRALLTLPWYLVLYLCGRLADWQAKEKLLIAFFRGESRAEIARFADRFGERWVRRRLRPALARILEAHRARGHRLVLLSASPDLYVGAIAGRLEIDLVVCTRVAFDDDLCDGRIAGTNCKAEAKVEALKHALAIEAAPPGSWAYGDSRSDLAILRWVECGYLLTKPRATLPFRSGRPGRSCGAVDSGLAELLGPAGPHVDGLGRIGSIRRTTSP
jgi:phosphatidylglycerophosphatase C